MDRNDFKFSVTPYSRFSLPMISTDLHEPNIARSHRSESATPKGESHYQSDIGVLGAEASHLESRAIGIQRRDRLPHTIASNAQSKSPVQRAIKKTFCPMPGCDRVILQRVLARHLRTVHSQGPSRICETCDLGFLRKDALERHRSEQHSESIDTVECTRCGSRTVQRALKEHQSSRRCLKAVVYDRVSNIVPNIQYSIDHRDGLTSLRAAAWYLVEIGNHRRQQSTTDFTVLEARQAAIGNLVNATKYAIIDVTMACAIWIFGLAELTQGGSADVHQAALAKAEKRIDKRKAVVREILLGAFERCRSSQSSRPARLGSTCHIKRQHDLTTDDCDVAGCGFITRLAGFETAKANFRSSQMANQRQDAEDSKCPLWPTRSCFDATQTGLLKA